MPKLFTSSIILILFIIDLMVPLGVAIAVLYIIPLVLSYALDKDKIKMLAIICTILTLIDSTDYYYIELYYNIFINRLLSIIAIWVSYFIILRYKEILLQKDIEKQNYLKSVTKMLFQVSHEVRSPLCTIQGLTNHIDSKTISKEELESISIYLKDSVTELDIFTRNLTHSLEKIRIQITYKSTNSNYYL
ncbi:hypothetical protein SAMN04488062_1186 [Flavobacterium omnivorum]|uniref:His Kinase A (Phospho-acceptor) domain-containing protein n=2 Tax=Flavobacterium omnivorum TaxID=178355 RepID=A0A1G8GFF3_9FLAO|nr:hypothetical protein SAMN04488062_1186 [Flavobacterium omnivorum]